MIYSVQAFKDLLKMYGTEQRNDNEILTLIIEMYKAHKKMKNASQKESPFSSVLVDAYKSYAEGKVRLQENVNYLDSANKFCGCLTNGLKNQEKQQQLTGVRQTLEELGIRNLTASLPKMNIMNTVNTVNTVNTMNTVAFPVPTPIVSGIQIPNPIVAKVPAITKAVTTGVTPVTTTSAVVSAVPSMTTITPVSSRPRGRPPGSKNSTSKADAMKNQAMQGKLIASLLPFASSLSNSELIPALRLLTDPNFMKTLAMNPDLASANSWLRESPPTSNFANVSPHMDGFQNAFTSSIAASLQPNTSLAKVLPSQVKPAKVEKMATLPKSSAMSIFPTTNKPHPSLSQSPNISPSKSSASPSISASITPVASTSLLKTGSTVISVGSGQLTITPSISITSNSTKPTTILPQMSAPSFSVQKPTQPKVRRSAGDQTTKKSQKAKKLSLGIYPQGIYPDLPLTMENLPKSLSITPSPNSFTADKPATLSQLNADLLSAATKPVKQPRAKKKSMDGSKNTAMGQPKMPIMHANLVNQAITSKQAQLNSLMNPFFFEQLMSGVTQTPLSLPKPTKSKTTAVTSAKPQQQKSGIKVKQLDQLQDRPIASKISEKPPPKLKQTFSTPNMSGVKGTSISRNSAILNTLNTTISIPHSHHPMPTSYSTLSPPAAATNLAANLQTR